MNYLRIPERGLIITGNAFDKEVMEIVDCEFGKEENNHIAKFPLIICDPPYGDIVDEQWDVSDYFRWMTHCQSVSQENTTICMWGGIGKLRNRPFLEFAANVETMFPMWTLKNWITWKKRRAYGKKDDYLFVREECLILTRGIDPIFNIPLLDKKRGYAGYNKKYPAKSEFLRRTNVWTDITELFRDKIHPCQKPDKLYQVLIQAHSNPGDTVYDPCAGSLTTMRAAEACGRRFCCVERSSEYIQRALSKAPVSYP